MDTSVNLDFETYSELDLTKVGAWRYSTDPSTEVLCAAIHVEGHEPWLWTPGVELSKHVLRAIEDPRSEFRAWNAGFEIAIWTNAWVRQIGIKCPPIHQWIDTMALAAYFGLPQKLSVAGNVTGVGKLSSGQRLINMLTMPTAAGERRTPETHPHLFEELYEYCLQDVVAEKAVLEFMPSRYLPEMEQRIWLENQVGNMTGVRVDTELVQALSELRDKFVERESERFDKMTGLQPTQTQKVRNWLMDEHLVNLPNMQKDTIDQYLERDDLEDTVRDVLTIRRQVAQVASKKLDAMIRYAGPTDRIHDLKQYHGASTGRFAGRGVQLENLMRGVFKTTDADPDIFKCITGDDIPLLYGTDPMSAVGTMIRPCIIADEGCDMFIADYSAVEARGVAWLAGAKRLLRAFRTHGKVYEDMASQIFACELLEVDDDQRFVGKQAVLGCGYQAGAAKFLEMCISYGRDIGEELAEKAVSTYREKNSEVVDLWYAAEKAVKSAVRNPGKIYSFGVGVEILVRSTGKYLKIRLPSGRDLHYSMPRVEVVEKVFKEGEDPVMIEQIRYMGVDSYTRRWTLIDLYGGKIIENVVQALCRDLMCYALVNLIDEGYDFLFTVHDEIVCQTISGTRTINDYIMTMTALPDWAPEFPLAAEGHIAQRFSK